MQTAAFVTLVQEEIGASWSRTRILEAMNRAQNEILGAACSLMRVKPDPFLATAATTFSYAASSKLYVSTTGAQGALVGDIRAVREIYLDASSLSLLDTITLDTNFSRVIEREWLPHEVRCHVKFDTKDSLRASASDCTIIWPVLYDPGATTLTWRARAYTWPTQLTAETVALSIPDDYLESLLLQRILQNVRRREYGRDDLDDYKKELGRFHTKYSKTPTRNFDMTAVPRAL